VCIDILKKAGVQVDRKSKLSSAELKKIIGEYDGLIVRSGTNVTADIIEAAHKMTAIGRAGTGVDNIDCNAATKKGIIVMNTPGGNTISAAEHTCALIASLARNVAQGDGSMKQGNWDRKQYMGVELAGKTLGVLGLGRVGREVVFRMQAFGMTAIGYDPFFPPEASQKLDIEPVSAAECIRCLPSLTHPHAQASPLHAALGLFVFAPPLGDVLPPHPQAPTSLPPLPSRLSAPSALHRRADFLTIHVPLLDDTRDMINKASIATMKPGARIVNCARGGIINEADLLAALESGHLAGAALDVFESEPPSEHEWALIKHPKLIATPHLGASTIEAQGKVAEEIAHAIVAAFAEMPVTGVVNAPDLTLSQKPELKPWTSLATSMGALLAQVPW
jgi:phosphoglycerate dehydrogenase-like enzyme